MTDEELKILAAGEAYINSNLQEIEICETRALRLHEQLKKWHLSEKGRTYAKLYQQLQQEISVKKED